MHTFESVVDSFKSGKKQVVLSGKYIKDKDLKKLRTVFTVCKVKDGEVNYHLVCNTSKHLMKIL